MDPCVLGGVPAVRVASRLQLATFFTADSPFSRHGRIGPPPALTVDVRVVIRRHFPVVGPGGTWIVEKVAEDLVLRRRPSRQLRQPEKVDRALTKDVMPLVRHRFDRGAVVASGKDICAHVAAACADPRMAHCGAHVLVLIDTYACPVVFRHPPPSNKQMQPVVCMPSLKNFMLSKTADPCVDFEITTEKWKSVGVIGDRRPKPVGVIGDKQPKPEVEERFKGWLPW